MAEKIEFNVEGMSRNKYVSIVEELSKDRVNQEFTKREFLTFLDHPIIPEANKDFRLLVKSKVIMKTRTDSSLTDYYTPFNKEHHDQIQEGIKKEKKKLDAIAEKGAIYEYGFFRGLKHPFMFPYKEDKDDEIFEECPFRYSIRQYDTRVELIIYWLEKIIHKGEIDLTKAEKISSLHKSSVFDNIKLTLIRENIFFPRANFKEKDTIQLMIQDIKEKLLKLSDDLKYKKKVTFASFSSG